MDNDARSLIKLKFNKIQSATLRDAYNYIHICAFKGLDTRAATVCFEIARSIFARDRCIQYTLPLLRLQYALLNGDKAATARAALIILNDEHSDPPT